MLNTLKAVIPAREWPESSARDGFLDSGLRRHDAKKLDIL
jgi:hypothetical protein